MTSLRALLLCAVLASAVAQAQNAEDLRAQYGALQRQLAGSPFGRALLVESTTSGARHKGEIHAVIHMPHHVVVLALADSGHWCEILALQFSVKGCKVSGDRSGGTLTTLFTRDPRDPPSSAYRIDFHFHVAAASADYLSVALNAAAGPIGTRDYQIRVEAAQLDSHDTFVHMSYAYTLGVMARIAIQAYLIGPGRHKFGFSVVDHLPEGHPVYVKGVRGIVERNVMRYYLGMETSLQSLDLPPDTRLEARLPRWYADVSRYPQLREPISLDEYIAMKRRESQRLTAIEGKP